jgi:hypothetical protein|tara:strand:+ start:209 stop:1747 length:1539 start_codon:yes stop_codon:yes gene_type:complete
MPNRTIYETEAQWEQVQELVTQLEGYVCQAVGREELHEVEDGLFRRLQQLGRALLERFVAESGTGYSEGQPPCTLEGEPLGYKGIETVSYLSIFGSIGLPRAAYARPEGGYEYPMDGQWNRPAHKQSYLLRKWLHAVAVEGDYHEAAQRLNEMFDLALWPHVAQRLGSELGAQTEAYYQQQEAPPADTEGRCVGVSADGKGVRLLRADRGSSRTDAEEDSKPRLGKGEKRGTKKEAIVTAVFTFDPEARDPEEVVRSLMKRQTPEEREEARRQRQQRRLEGRAPPRSACNKHLRATLEGKEVAFGHLMERVRQRDPAGDKPLVALLDGDAALEEQLHEQLRLHHLEDRLDALILDVIHASEYVWEVGTALYGERNPQREVWVEEKLRALLHGQVGRVVGGFKQRLTKSNLTGAQEKALRKAITYFDNHRHMMDYATYLAKGYPIGTGLIEGACGYLVKNRMEGSGMRWSRLGAEAMLQQRAVKKNGDWNDFWSFHIDSERDRLYPATYKEAA